IRDCTFSGGGPGLVYCNNATVSDCRITDTPFVNLTVYNGYIWFGIMGINMYSCDNALIANNKLNNTGRGGIDLFHSIPSRIIGNEIRNSGIDAIMLWMTRDATVTGNYINNTWGHSISLNQVSRTDICLNFFGYTGNCSIGIFDSSLITWHDDTYGNYYFEYNGLDENGDGIGDTPFEINSENIDPYPLVDRTHINEYTSSVFVSSPEISNVTIGPNPIMVSGNATVNATIVAEFVVSKAILSFSTDGGTSWTNVTMTFKSGIWTATIENVEAGSIQYKIYAMDSIGNWAVSDVEEVAVSFLDVLTIGTIVGVVLVAIIAIAVVLKKKSG
ncbi:MAG: hypothetical protein KAR33_03255, partial [Candidatus Thorarchaeota archaeon]|nr:hypothetical protein [Candidatus Thorarchaeota archaeon]